MRSPNVTFKMILGFLTLAALTACSNGSDSATSMINAAGKHVVGTGYTNWVQQHWVEYKLRNGGSRLVSSLTACSQCHGTDLQGGIVKVSCFENFNGMTCHPDPFKNTLGHHLDWGDPTAVNFHGKTATVQGSNTLSADCSLCHSLDQNKVIVGNAPSCLSTDQTLACHFASPAAKVNSVVSSTGCISCHSYQATGPGQVGVSAVQVRPNLAGTHATHITELNIGCKACHWKGGSGTINHAVNAQFKSNIVYLNLSSSAYNAQNGGPFAYNPSTGSCTAVSCHGGVETPNWYNGQLTVTDGIECMNCHTSYSPLDSGTLPQQYNSYVSGKQSADKLYATLHLFHLGRTTRNDGSPLDGGKIICTTCHNAAILVAPTHPSGLATPAFEIAPKNTLVNTGAASLNYDPVLGTCTVNCHFGKDGSNNYTVNIETTPASIFVWK